MFKNTYRSCGFVNMKGYSKNNVFISNAATGDKSIYITGFLPCDTSSTGSFFIK